VANELDVSYVGSGTPYAIIRRISDGHVWDGDSFDAWVDGTITSYDVALSSLGGDYYAATFPSAIASGNYRIFYYESTGTPAITDILLDTEERYWNGTALTSSPSGTNLSTLARVKEYLGIASATTTYDAKINTLLTAVSRYVEKDCGVELFLNGTYTEYHNGNSHGFLTTRNVPITAVTRVATCPMTVLEIKNTLTSVQRATVSVSSANLTTVSTAAGVSTTTNNGIAVYTTLALMKTAIESVSGWECEIASGYESYPTADLRVIQHASAGRDDGPAEIEMYVDELPISRIDEAVGTIWGCFPRGIQNIEVKYTAGYADVDSLPEDLEQAVVALTGSFFELSQTGSTANVKGEKIGDYAIQYFESTGSLLSTESMQSVSLDAFMLLAAYRRPIL
jgi:hypothetical protein